MWAKYTVCAGLLNLSPAPITERYFPIKAVLFTGGQDKLKSLWKSEWQQQDRWWLEGVWGCRLECIIMHRTAGSRDWEGCWAWVLSELSPQFRSVCPETSPLNHQEQSWKPWEGTLHCPTESTHTFALQKCQTEIGIHRTHTHPNTQAHTYTVATVVSSRLSLSCVPGLYSCCPLWLVSGFVSSDKHWLITYTQWLWP